MNTRKILFKFLITGGISTGIDFIIYIILSNSIDLIFAKIISMLCASVISYIMNKSWTFQNKEKTNWKYLIKFYLSFIINLIVNVTINQLIYSLTLNKIVAFVIATACATIINYILQKIWVFKNI